MATALENLKANLAARGMLVDGEIPARYWLRDTDAVSELAPAQMLANVGDGDVTPTATAPRTPAQDFRDYWNLDNDWLGTRDLLTAGSAFSPLFSGAKMFADEAYGVNPYSTAGGMLGGIVSTIGADTIPQAVLRGVTGSKAGEYLGSKVGGSTIGDKYYGLYSEGMKDSPWHAEATAMGLEVGTPGYDHFMNAVTGGLAYNKEVDPEMMKAYDEREQENWRYYFNEDEDHDPTVDNSMFGTIGSAFQSVLNSITDSFDGFTSGGSDDTPDYSGLTKTGQIDWTQYGDTSEGEQEAQANSGFHDSSHNWN